MCLVPNSPSPGTPYAHLLWVNKAAIQRFGQPRTQEARQCLVDGLPSATREYMKNTMQMVHDNIVVGLDSDLTLHHTRPASIAAA